MVEIVALGVVAFEMFTSDQSTWQLGPLGLSSGHKGWGNCDLVIGSSSVQWRRIEGQIHYSRVSEAAVGPIPKQISRLLKNNQLGS